MEQIYDLVIIGAGIAGLSAAISAAGSDLDTILIEKNDTPGGELLCQPDIQNFPGFPKISGSELTSMLKEHAELTGCIFLQDTVKEVLLKDAIKTVKTDKKEYSCKGVILACGSCPDFRTDFPSAGFDSFGRIRTLEDCRTDIARVYAAGDVRAKVYNEIVNAISDGSNAVSSFLVDIK